jgi:hypothetical protein
MTRFDGERVRARLLTGGFTQAYERFQDAQTANDPQAAFFALFETLNWAHAVDDLIALTWSPRGQVQGYDWRTDRALAGSDELADIMRGLRYARNRVHHQWAAALDMGKGQTSGLAFPVSFPVTFGAVRAWVWRRIDDLPTPPNEGREAPGRAAYINALDGRPPQAALAIINEAFTFIGSLLDPPIPVRTPPIVEIPQP